MGVYLSLPQPELVRIVLEPSLFSVITTSESESGQLLIKKTPKTHGDEISLSPEYFYSELHRLLQVLFHRVGKGVAYLGGLFLN